MAKIYPYLIFDNAKKAMDYYVDQFGAEIIAHRPLSEEQIESLGLDPDQMMDTTMQAEFSIAGQVIVCADALMSDPQVSSRVAIMLDFEDDERAAKDMFQRLSSSDQQRVTIPFGERDNDGQMGQIVDAYGITWQISAGMVDAVL